jgi:hypothetical protein
VPGLRNVSATAAVTGNLQLELRQGNEANSFYARDAQPLATVSTSTGSFEMRGNAQLAWLYDTDDLGGTSGPGPDYVVDSDRERSESR